MDIYYIAVCYLDDVLSKYIAAYSNKIMLGRLFILLLMCINLLYI